MTDETWAAVARYLTALKMHSEYLKQATDPLAPEGSEEPFTWAFWELANSGLEACSRLIGDANDTLTWWVYECEMGAAPLEAGTAAGERRIETLDDLRWLLEQEAGAQ